MSSLNKKTSGDGVLTIPVGDGTVFQDACANAAADESARVVVIHLTGDREAVEPGAPALLAALGMPVVAGLSGRIEDRALELALAADIRVCEPETTFAMMVSERGKLPSDGGTQRLPRVVGPGLAADMLLIGRTISAEEAFAAGLVTEIAAPRKARQRADEIATAIVAHGRAASVFTKEAVLKGGDMPLEHALHLEADLAILLHTDPERAEGIDAFKERRQPGFRPTPPGKDPET